MTLTIGEVAPDFSLLDTEGRKWSVASYDGAPATVLVFTCNHCPYALAWQDRIAEVANDYAARGVRGLAVNSNDADRFVLDPERRWRYRAAPDAHYDTPGERAGGLRAALDAVLPSEIWARPEW